MGTSGLLPQEAPQSASQKKRPVERNQNGNLAKGVI